MLKGMQAAAFAAASVMGTSAVASTDGEWSGSVAIEARLFASAPLDHRQSNHSFSLAAETEYYVESESGRNSLLFKSFLRDDNADSHRTHFDVRELMWQYVGDTWELRAGIGKVFWGVTEGQHLVDIINQTDLVESSDGEDKLGQPMVNLALIQDWGTVNLFLLPGFRERTYPGVEGRLRTTPYVDADRASYESGAEDRHIDIAIRYSHYFGDFDVGVSHFYGTSREPRFLTSLTSSREVVLVPHYDLIHQTGIDVQITRDAWLWKLEAIRRSGQGSPFLAATGGFEYTLYGVMESTSDVGVIGEYLYNSKGEVGGGAFQNDLLTGVRLAFNDEQDTNLLFGVMSDLDNGTKLLSLEANRRLADDWKLSLEARLFLNVEDTNPLFTVRRDDYLEIQLVRFF